MATGKEEKRDDTNEDGGSFDQFLSEVKQIEKRDSVLTSAQQIDRLLRPGSKYANLNPYDVHPLPCDNATEGGSGHTETLEVLMIDPETPPEQIRKAYRKLSFLVHPDKNIEARERAQNAFEAVNKAYKMLDDPEQVEYCQGVWEEAKATVDSKLKEKRKIAKKDGEEKIEEDDPAKYKQLVHNAMMKLFADYDIKKQQMEEREVNERKRQKDLEEEEQAKAKREKEMKEQWESDRVERITSWRDFQSKGIKKSKKIFGYKPPKHRQEKRT